MLELTNGLLPLGNTLILRKLFSYCNTTQITLLMTVTVYAVVFQLQCMQYVIPNHHQFIPASPVNARSTVFVSNCLPKCHSGCEFQLAQCQPILQVLQAHGLSLCLKGGKAKATSMTTHPIIGWTASQFMTIALGRFHIHIILYLLFQNTSNTSTTTVAPIAVTINTTTPPVIPPVAALNESEAVYI